MSSHTNLMNKKIRNRTETGKFRLKDSTFGFLLFLPILIWLAFTIVYPLLYSIYLSFQNTKIIGSTGSFAGFKNYSVLLQDSAFWVALRNSLYWTVGNALVQVTFGLAVALLLAYPLKKHKWFQPIIILPWVLPIVVLSLMWKWLLSSSYGVINGLLMQWGWIEEPFNFLGSTVTSMLAVILINSWRWFPLFVIIFLAAIQNIPQEEFDAAAMENASFWKQFASITMPHIAPTLIVMQLVGTILSFNVFDIIYLLTRGGPLDTTTTLPVMVYKTVFEGYRLSEAATLGVLIFVILMLFAFLILYSGKFVSYLRGAKDDSEG